MKPEIKKYIESNIDKITNKDFEYIYTNYKFSNIGELTEVLLNAGINPLLDMTYVPHMYLSETGVTQVDIPPNIDVIGISAFEGCTELKHCVIPESVRQIMSSAFQFSGIETIVLPELLEYMSSCVFYESKLKEIIISDNIKVIQSDCFSKCYDLKKVTLGKFTRQIANYSFANCKSLETFDVSRNTDLYKIGNYAFKGCTSLRKIFLPETVRRISDVAFEGCSPVIQCHRHSEAQQFAIRNKFQIELV